MILPGPIDHWSVHADQHGGFKRGVPQFSLGTHVSVVCGDDLRDVFSGRQTARVRHQGSCVQVICCFCAVTGRCHCWRHEVSDYWHHPTDVIAGALIGFWTAVFSYHQYYPVLFSHRSDMPFDPRGPPVSCCRCMWKGRGRRSAISLCRREAAVQAGRRAFYSQSQQRGAAPCRQLIDRVYIYTNTNAFICFAIYK
ncbi:hypothetical protein BX661DRAFT_95609 [Kickxella alabastrina]|uniref:uncharacterized protein n=1 Tax=Kickxella alabastrina TaxID=61397 RepID=UPI00221FFA2F|nr:uncharacterized protein BX661DRAFT_95609 [Kickxella alabastrina]KAI7829953.1 hypothetical protein BX661DRAFT_95609 [Kickxella alabastrina]